MPLASNSTLCLDEPVTKVKKNSLCRVMYRQKTYFKYINMYAYVGRAFQESENHRLCFCFSEIIPFFRQDCYSGFNSWQ
jgi:hypothetical protein